MSRLKWTHTLSRLLTLIAVMITIPLQAQGIKITKAELKKEINWTTPPSEYQPGSAKAIQGGTLNLSISQRPGILRRFGPGTPTPFSRILDQLQLPLAAQSSQLNRASEQPEVIPMLAKHWHWDAEARELMLELKSYARWSDGGAVTSDDLIFTLEFLTNPDNQTPYQAQVISSIIESAIQHDSYRVTLRLKPNANYIDALSLQLLPKHFYSQTGHWPYAFDRLIEPTTGAYEVRLASRQGNIFFKRKAHWWADQDPFFTSRFNPSEIQLHYFQPSYRYYDSLKSGQLDLFRFYEPLLADEETNAIKNLSNFLPINKVKLKNPTPTFQTLISRKNDKQPGKGKELISCMSDTEGETLQEILDKFNWESPAEMPDRITQTSCQQILQHLRKGDFDHLALTLSGKNQDSIRNYLTSQGQYSEQLAVQAVRIPGLKQGYMAWQWIRLPKDTQSMIDPLNPFDPVHGGMFWIDPQIKHNTLSRNFWRSPSPGSTIDLSQ